MPKIDMGPFGRDVAPAVQRGAGPRVVPGAYDRSQGITALGQGVGQAADIVARDAENQRRRDQAEATQIAYEQDKARRIEETTRAQQNQIAFATAAEGQLQTNLADDAVPNDQKVAKFQAWAATEREGLEPTYKVPEVLGAQQVYFDSITAKGITGLKEGIMLKDQAGAKANVASSIEQLTRQAATTDDPQALIDKANGIVRSAGVGAGWAADDVQKITQQNAEAFSLASASRRVLEDPAAALEALRSDQYPHLSPEARTALEGRAMAELEQRANQARIAGEVRAAKAGRAMDALDRAYRDGVQPTPAMVATAADLARGTEYEGTIQAMQSMAAERASFSGRPLKEQAQDLNALQARATDPAIGATDEERFQLNWKAQQHTALTRAIETRGALAVYADTHSVTLPDIDPSSSDTLAVGLAARDEFALQATIWSGRPVGPLRPEEVKAMGETMDQGTATQRLRMLDGLRKAMPDPVRFRATMGELAEGHANLATAGNMLQDGNNRAADLIVQGQVILAPSAASGGKAPPMPTDKALRPIFETETAGMFEGNAADRDRLYQSSRAVYAALSQEAGDYSDIISGERWRTAVDTAAGGIVDLDTWTTSGRRVIKPAGMSADDFTSSVRSASPDQVRSFGGVAGYTPEEVADAIRGGGLVNYRDGYAIRDGSHFLIKADGSGPFVWKP